MTWTYTFSPGSSPRDAVRLLLGDVEHADPQLQDEEIAWALQQQGHATAAAARLASVLAARFARQIDRSLGDLSASYAQRQRHYQALAATLERAAAANPQPYAGGLSASDKAGDDADGDRLRPSFRRGLHDAPQGTE